MRFMNRSHAGRKLARRLDHLKSERAVVLGLPRGGIPVGFEVARRMSAPLEVLLVRKLGAPLQPELAIGALGEGGIQIINEDRVRRLRIGSDHIDRLVRQERNEMTRQAEVFRQGRPAVDLAGKVAVIIDDGIATGSTALAACAIARGMGADRVVMAAPVAPCDASAIFSEAADEFVAFSTPRRFSAIGHFYADFRPTPDHQVVELLERARHG